MSVLITLSEYKFAMSSPSQDGINPDMNLDVARVSDSNIHTSVEVSVSHITYIYDYKS